MLERAGSTKHPELRAEYDTLSVRTYVLQQHFAPDAEHRARMSKVRAARRRSAWRRGRERRKIVLRMSTLSATQRGSKRGVKE